MNIANRNKNMRAKLEIKKLSSRMSWDFIYKFYENEEIFIVLFS